MMRRLILLAGLLQAESALNCIDFVISSNIDFAGDDLKVIRISRGQAECVGWIPGIFDFLILTNEKLNEIAYL